MRMTSPSRSPSPSTSTTRDRRSDELPLQVDSEKSNAALGCSAVVEKAEGGKEEAEEKQQQQQQQQSSSAQRARERRQRGASGGGLPVGNFDLLNIPGVGPANLRKLVEKGIGGVAELKQLYKDKFFGKPSEKMVEFLQSSVGIIHKNHAESILLALQWQPCFKFGKEKDCWPSPEHIHWIY